MLTPKAGSVSCVQRGHLQTPSQPAVLPALGRSWRTAALPSAEALAFAAGITAAAAAAAPIVLDKASGLLKPRKCEPCLGTGYVVCSACQGTGRQGFVLPGQGLAATLPSCSMCARRGRCACTSCNASGLANSWLWKPAADPGWGPRGY